MKNYLSTSDSIRYIILAPNAFKGSLSAMDFCQILTKTFQTSPFYTIQLPMFDGGDGTASVISFYLKAAPHTFVAEDALNRPHKITYYSKGDTAIFDLADVCGLKFLKPEEYDILNANTRGLGKVLLHLVEEGYKSIILGLGGSASVDGGLGALEAMGAEITKTSHQYRNPLIELEDFNAELLKERLADTELLILCDVKNVLCGPEGAAHVFAPQKGANAQQVELLENKMVQYAELLKNKTGINPQRIDGTGAAGGVAAAFRTVLHASLISGADYSLLISNFHHLLPGAFCVITGEGKLDNQSLCGKLPGQIAALCHKYSKPVYAISGLAEQPLPDFTEVCTLANYAPDLQESIAHPKVYLRHAAKELKKNIAKSI